jgi:hypothetical protein
MTKYVEQTPPMVWTERDREITLKGMYAQGEKKADVCQDCQYAGFGASSTYHILYWPGHRLESRRITDLIKIN